YVQGQTSIRLLVDLRSGDYTQARAQHRHEDLSYGIHRAIKKSTSSQEINIGQQTQPGDCHGMVSWREYRLFLEIVTQAGTGDVRITHRPASFTPWPCKSVRDDMGG